MERNGLSITDSIYLVVKPTRKVIAAGEEMTPVRSKTFHSNWYAQRSYTRVFIFSIVI